MKRDDLAWLECDRGDRPLVVSLPHTGVEIPVSLGDGLVSGWLALKDTDWHVEKLYDFAGKLGATVIRTRLSRTVIDVNRDPSGASLYPGQATTGLCPTTTFDGEPLYSLGREPAAIEIGRRRALWFDPYHAALSAEIDRLGRVYSRVVVYDCHSIRSVIPRLFQGELPHVSIGTNHGGSCDLGLTAAVEAAIEPSPFSQVTNGRFRGGYITRNHGQPKAGVHAIQMEIAMRSYVSEPVGPLNHADWPPEYDQSAAGPLRSTLFRVLEACLAFASDQSATAC
jgi:N-formylglutamate deformylase